LFCAFNKGEERGHCSGDSGGPLIARNDQTKAYTLVGVVSRSKKKDGRCGTQPGKYVNVHFYLDWINDIIGEPDCDKPSGSGSTGTGGSGESGGGGAGETGGSGESGGGGAGETGGSTEESEPVGLTEDKVDAKSVEQCEKKCSKLKCFFYLFRDTMKKKACTLFRKDKGNNPDAMMGVQDQDDETGLSKRLFNKRK